MRGSRKLCQRGSNSDNGLAFCWVFLVVEKKIQTPLKVGNHWSARIALLAQAHGSFVIFQGIWTSIPKKPYNLVIFQGWGCSPDSLFPNLDPCMLSPRLTMMIRVFSLAQQTLDNSVYTALLKYLLVMNIFR